MEDISFSQILQTYLLPLVYAIVIFIVGKWLSGILRDFFRKVLRAREVDEVIVSFAGNVLYFILLAVVIMAALNKLGVDTTSAVAIFGALTLAIGFALQNSLGNFASGIMILIFKPFKIGDFIEAGGITGIVNDLSIFDTHLTTPDNKKIVLPNGQVTAGPITNFTHHDTRRMDLVVGVSYEDDLRKVKAVLSDVLDKDEGVLKDPEYNVGVLEMADSSINFAVRPWVKTEEYWDVFFRLNMAIKLRLDEEGITIPFPQQDVHMHQVDPKPAA
ncbi:MAG: mechanosensitive ion channel domain-containing protein [Verrucomicrobiota bacterium]